MIGKRLNNLHKKNVHLSFKGISLKALGLFTIVSLTGCNKVIETSLGAEEENAYISETTEGNYEYVLTEHNENNDFLSGEINEDIELDVSDLPEDIQSMVPLCDALNIYQCESGDLYSSDDMDFIWNSVHIAIGNSDWTKEDIVVYEDTISVSANLVKEYLFAMYGDVKVMPQIPRHMIDDRQAFYAGTTKGTEIRYDFSLGDRGPSHYEVRSAILHPDTSVTLEVALVDSEDDSELVDFYYELITNTRDLSTSVRYQYEIVGAEAADELTKNKLEGVPYLTIVKQQYGENTNSEEEFSYDSVEEILSFTTAKRQAAVDRLNARIRNELLGISEDINTEIEWVEIKSYPVSTHKFVQVLVSYNVYPCYGTHGDVASYNYCIANKSAMTIEDAFVVGEITEEEVRDKLSKSDFGQYEEYAKYADSECQGFFIERDGSIDFYYKVFFESTTGGEPFDIIASINSTSGAVTVYDPDDDLIDKNLQDKMSPPLTHGK